MATHGIKATATFAAIALTGQIETGTHDFKRELSEFRVWGAKAVGRISGLEVATFTCSGTYDATVFQALVVAMKSETAGTLVFSPDGGAVTLTTPMRLVNIQSTAPANGHTTYTLNMSADGETVVG